MELGSSGDLPDVDRRERDEQVRPSVLREATEAAGS